MRKIAFIAGDGVGSEVAGEAEKVLQAVVDRSGLELQVDHFDYGAQKYLDEGITLPDEQIEEFHRDYAAIFIGALGDPRIPDDAHVRDMLPALRLKLDLYVNYRPIRLINDRYCPLKRENAGEIDFEILRENLEGINSCVDGVFKRGTENEELIQQSIITRRGVRRIHQFAFDYARKKGYKKVTICDSRPNFYPPVDFWKNEVDVISKDFQEIESEFVTLPELLNILLNRPEELELVVACNNFGDIVAEVGSEIQGGCTQAIEKSFNPGRISLYMPVHGPLNDQAGKNAVSPLAAITCMAMLLGDFGFEQEARWINAAVKYAIDTENITNDLGGRLTTSQVGDFIADQIKRGAHQ